MEDETFSVNNDGTSGLLELASVKTREIVNNDGTSGLLELASV
jgi:hypothetical protein